MILFKSRGALFGECWYDEPPPRRDSGVDVVACRQTSAPLPDARCTPFLTIVSDLSAEPDALFDQFGKNCRQKIKRAEARDELEIEFAADPAACLGEFTAYYDAFAKQKGLRPANREWLRGACAAGNLALASARRHDETLVWHGYIVAGDTVWLQYSASVFRRMSNADRALVARANRWLHWRSILRFKELGVARYDWGGLFEDESVPEQEGINRFKREFGGRPTRAYDCVLPVTVRGRLRLGLNRLGDSYRALRALPKRLFPAQPAAAPDSPGPPR